AEITVGAASSAVVFNLPKELLCKSSTYFTAALNNGFSETTTQRIVLDDDDPDIFRTYAVWLFQEELKRDCLDEVSRVQHHLFHLYIFADKRGIVKLANDVVTMMASYWDEKAIDMSVTQECLPLVSSQCTLYRLTLDSLLLESRSAAWNEEKWEQFGRHPQDVMLELFRKERHFPGSFQEPDECIKSICHYHEHNGNVREQVDCAERVERGCNTWEYYPHGGPQQVAWEWDAVTGPIAQVIVGLGDNIEEFSVHKKLLCDSSTYFKAALTNGFVETRDQKITLDDENPAIFRTFVVWLYEKKLNKETMPPSDEKEALQRHMLELYVFADKRGIINLLNDTITMLASRWAFTNVSLNNIDWLFPLISHTSKLYQLLVDNVVLELQDTSEIRRRLVKGDLPRTALIDISLRRSSLPREFKAYDACFKSVCHYHLHDQQGSMSKEECIGRIEAGDNVWSSDLDCKQSKWNWD
ncbi:hypothetical protein KCU64_g15137, partial [Aureobasidium melanogenum]